MNIFVHRIERNLKFNIKYNQVCKSNICKFMKKTFFFMVIFTQFDLYIKHNLDY